MPSTPAARRLLVADALALAALGPAVAVSGALCCAIALPALPALALGLLPAPRWLVATVALVLAAAGTRYLTLGRDAAARDEESVVRLAREFVLVAETLLRWAAHGSEGVEMHRSGGGNTLVASGQLSPARLRGLARLQAAEGRRVLLLNLCRSWRGWDSLAAELGLESVAMPSGQVYVVDAVDEVRRRMGGGGPKPLLLLAYCETGAVAAAVAAAYLATAGVCEPAEAAARVARAAEGRLACHLAELQAVAGLADSLAGGGKRRAKKGKAPPPSGKPPADKPRAEALAGSGAAEAAAEELESSSESGEDGGGPLGEAAREREQEARRQNYMQAVRQYGAPGSTPLHVAGAPSLGGGWTTVTAPKPSASRAAQPAASAWSSGPPGGLSEKQRKNRRKAEKAKEASVAREEEQRQRLHAAGLSRGAR